MKEGFGRFWKTIRNDKAKLGSWGCILGAGVLTLVAGLFDQHSKNKQYESVLREEIQKKLDKTMDT